ncbi:MAG TPA: prolyl oligopeptidase family serine peptidase [Acidimicrobiales bacterium]|nr:prolyl oligopeptidase family serine peptidase [Acidimicrobiales bacterium]
MADGSVHEAPYGAWRSPIAARDVARGAVRLGRVDFGPDGCLWWSEARPSEGGRTVVVRRAADGAKHDMVPEGWNVRTRAHEYGGRAWIPVGESSLVFANWEDQRVYLVDARGGEPVPLTPVPSEPQADHYADMVLTADGTEVMCVRERLSDGGRSVRRDLAAIPLDGSLNLRSLVVDGHFLSNPRPSPDGRRISWLTWDHPRMPWDGTELRVGEVARDGSVTDPRTLLGGEEESVFQPEWRGPDALYAVSDRSGWWNLYEVGTSGQLEALCECEEEFGRAQWIFGMCTHAELGDGRIAVLHGKATWSLSLLDPGAGDLTPISRDLAARFEYFEPAIAARGDLVAAIGGGPTTPLSVVVVDTRTGRVELARSSVDDLPPPRYLPIPRQEVFGGPGGRDVHATAYAPRNPDFVAPKGERPPYVVFVHGGPTAQASPVLDLEVAFFTTRGIGVVDVDYGGSTGYGREYRNRLRGNWGVVDVEDVVAVADGLADRGDADRRRLLIRGGSAGGWTVLSALTRTSTFAGGASYYGVADLVGLVEDTHDFESRYIDGLVGPLPASRALYEERSPLSHVDELECPILLLQGTEDKIVTPRQAEMFRDAMARKGIAHAYIFFEGEQHGFRKAENIERALEAELSFYGQVLCFEPPGVEVLPLTRGGS